MGASIGITNLFNESVKRAVKPPALLIRKVLEFMSITDEEYIKMQDLFIKKRLKFVESMPFLYFTDNVTIKARPIYSQIFGTRYYTDPKIYVSEKSKEKAYYRMKEEVEAKNYGEYILSKREEGFREYVKNAMGRYAGLTIINYNKLTTEQKLLVLFNTDIFKVIGSPDKNTMGDVFDDIKGLFDWAKSQTK